MQRTLSPALATMVGRRATIQGWVHRRRRLSAVSFLIVRDRCGLAQVVVSDEDVRAQLDGLTEETVVSVDGAVTANAQAPGGFELTDPHITKLSSPAVTPPVELWRPCLNASLPTLLDHAPVLWRHQGSVMFEIWSVCVVREVSYRHAGLMRLPTVRARPL